MQTTQRRTPVRAPAGCEGYLTRKQAALLLGLKSEFKIRQLEREGVLRSVRGAMRTAYYPRGELLALRARLGSAEPQLLQADAWSDADLLALLAHPRKGGGQRSALDLVLETNISIERAERVFAFWSKGRSSASAASEPQLSSAQPPTTPDLQAREQAQDDAESNAGERRGQARLEHDDLIRMLRDPDPKVRDQAFARLKHRRDDGRGARPGADPEGPRPTGDQRQSRLVDSR
jgi:hypothetical protein